MANLVSQCSGLRERQFLQERKQQRYPPITDSGGPRPLTAPATDTPRTHARTQASQPAGERVGTPHTSARHRAALSTP